MKQIPSTILILILILVMTFVLLGTIGGNNDADAADAYLQRCSAELQVCNFSDEVIANLKTEAIENGYELSVEKKTDSKGDVLYAYLEMKYKYTIPFISMESEHTKSIISK